MVQKDEKGEKRLHKEAPDTEVHKEPCGISHAQRLCC